MDWVAIKLNSGLAVILENRYDNTFCDGKSHSERVHLGWFWVRDNLEHTRKVAGCECFRVVHVFAILTLFLLELIQCSSILIVKYYTD